MTRKKKLLLNSATSLVFQIVTIVCGFILPRMILSCYGSTVNGLVSSITQFLGFISLCECGVGAVVQSTLYKPLADKDENSISRIVISSERFFRKISLILLVYTILLMAVYPLITLGSFDYLFTLLLIAVISVSTFAQFYFGITYRLLLNADQYGFIQYSISAAVLILNTVSCIILMQNGASIHAVKLVTSLLFLLQPALLCIIAKRKYKIDRSIVLTEEPIKQKWNGLAQHIAAVVLNNTDTVVLTLFSTLKNVSVYAVYHLVVNGVKQIVISLTNGTSAMLGNMLAKKEMKTLEESFDNIEWLIHTLVTAAFSVTAVLILPFVSVYTSSIKDANYLVPSFAYLITLSQASYCLRLPYNIMVLAAGHYKQTQKSAVIEAVINVAMSIILVFNFGLVGVALGTLAAMVYRTGYLAWYLSKNILFRKLSYFFGHLAVDILSAGTIFAVVKLFSPMFVLGSLSYLSWVILAVKVGAVSIACVFLVNAVFYRKKLSGFAKGMLSKLKK